MMPTSPGRVHLRRSTDYNARTVCGKIIRAMRHGVILIRDEPEAATCRMCLEHRR